MSKFTVPDNADGLWRKYFGSGRYHRYQQGQLNAAWQHQVALCGFETRTGNGAYSKLPTDGQPVYTVCRKCERLLTEIAA